MIKFGTAGHSLSYGGGPTVSVAPWLRERGLDAFEVQCGHGVTLGEKTAREIAASMGENGITVSVHAPYYISLSNPEKLESSLSHLRKACLAAKWLGAGRAVVHLSGRGGDDRDASMEQTKKALLIAREAALNEGWDDVSLCLETMGKAGSIGSLRDVLECCALSESFLPCLDFGHLSARSRGEDQGFVRFKTMLESVENALGADRARNMHIHFSKIEYTAAGERRHRTFEDNGGFGPDWEPLARLLAERDYSPTVICESDGTQAEDAMTMKKVYNEQKGITL